MKKLIIALAFLFVATTTFCQNNCPKITKLINDLSHGSLSQEFTTTKFTTSEDFDAYIAATQLDGAVRCYVQDVFNKQMYVAEFGTAELSSSANLETSFDNISSMLNTCLGTNFVHGQVKANSPVVKGIQYEGRGTYQNIKISLMVVNNPSSRKFEFFMRITKD